MVVLIHVFRHRLPTPHGRAQTPQIAFMHNHVSPYQRGRYHVYFYRRDTRKGAIFDTDISSVSLCMYWERVGLQVTRCFFLHTVCI